MILQLIIFGITATFIILTIVFGIGIPYTRERTEKIWHNDENGPETKIVPSIWENGFREERGYHEEKTIIEKSKVEIGNWSGGASGAWFVFFAVFAIASLFFAINDICVNSKIVKEKQYVEYQLQIDTLKQKQNTLKQMLDGDYVIDNDGTYHIIVDIPSSTCELINKYNKSVLDIKSEIYLLHQKATSNWIGWFYCKGYQKIENFNANATDYKTIISGLTEFVYEG
jgi:hypothetical protein